MLFWQPLNAWKSRLQAFRNGCIGVNPPIAHRNVDSSSTFETFRKSGVEPTPKIKFRLNPEIQRPQIPSSTENRCHSSGMKLCLLTCILAIMAEFCIPSQATIDAIAAEASEATRDRVFLSPTDGQLKPKVCCICEGMYVIENPCSLVEIPTVVRYLVGSKAEKLHLLGPLPSRSALSYTFPDELVEQYTAEDDRLKGFVLSPSTQVVKNGKMIDCVFVCKTCNTIFESNKTPGGRWKRGLFVSPSKAIWNGTLVGEAPNCIKDLNTAERALLSPNRIVTHAIALEADKHHGIYGWHSMFESDVPLNAAHINSLVNAGLQGEIVCVLCGPFTTTQEALARKEFKVRPALLIQAFEWLKEHNHLYRDLTIPSVDSIPMPFVTEDKNTFR